MSKLIELLTKGLEANPNDWNIRKGLIEQHALVKDSAALSEVIEGAPAMCDDEGVAVEIANILEGAGDEAARVFVESATEKWPTNSKLHGVAAKLQLSAGNMSAAGDHYTAAKTFDSSFSDPDLDAVSHLMGMTEEVEAAPVADPESQPVVAEPESEVTAPIVPAAASAQPVVEPEPQAQLEPEVIEEAHEVAPTAADAQPVMEEVSAASEIDSIEVAEVDELGAPTEVITADLSHTQSVAVVAELEPSALPAVPIQDLAAPPELAYEEVEPVVDLSFVPKEELELSRNHLIVVDPSGDELDADEIADSYEGGEIAGELLVADPGYAPEAAKKKDSKEKAVAILATVGAHVILFVLIGLIIIAAPRILPPEIVASPGPVSSDETITKKQVVQQTPTKPPAPSTSVMNTISSNVSSSVSVPSVEFESPDEPMELGSSFGSGLAFGTMGAAGGNISFMGNSGSGSRVVFAVDYSLSMGKFKGTEGPVPIKEIKKAIRDGNARQKHFLVRDELYTAIKKLPEGTKYQIVMFSGKAWAHDAVEVEWLDDEKIFADEGDYLLSLLDKKKAQSKGWGPDLDRYEFPKYKYLTSNPANIEKSCDIVARLPTSLGTNWEHPVLMALSIKPKPDIVFFMTDGTVGDPTRAMDMISEANSKGRKTVIHTTAMMEPKAAQDMSTLAAQNGGKFTIVERDGSITKGEDFFSKKK